MFLAKQFETHIIPKDLFPNTLYVYVLKFVLNKQDFEMFLAKQFETHIIPKDLFPNTLYMFMC